MKALYLASLVLGMAAACSSDDGNVPEGVATPQAVNEAYGITAYVAQSDSAVQELRFGAAALPSQEVNTQSEVGRTGDLRPLDIGFDQDAGPPQQSTTMTDLARIVSSECGMRQGFSANLPDNTDDVLMRSCVTAQRPLGAPYSRVTVLDNGTAGNFVAPNATYGGFSCTNTAANQPFLFFQDEPRTAAQVLQYQEVLLCAATKLSELAESDKPITWKNGLTGLRITSPSKPIPGGQLADIAGGKIVAMSADQKIYPITFKVVQPKDRFLVRDLAMELLSYVPLLDQFPIQDGTAWKTASQLFVDSAKANPAPSTLIAAYNTNNSVLAPDGPKFYPPILFTSVVGLTRFAVPANWDRTRLEDEHHKEGRQAIGT